MRIPPLVGSQTYLSYRQLTVTPEFHPTLGRKRQKKIGHREIVEPNQPGRGFPSLPRLNFFTASLRPNGFFDFAGRSEFHPN